MNTIALKIIISFNTVGDRSSAGFLFLLSLLLLALQHVADRCLDLLHVVAQSGLFLHHEVEQA